jgi:CotH kinase protein
LANRLVGLDPRDPEFMQDWIDRWQSLRQGVFSLNSLNALADSLTATIGPEAMARDLARWPMNTPEYTPGLTGGVTNMKAWFANRVAWIDDQFVAPPSVSSGGTSLTFSPATGAQMAYTLDGSDPRSLGGKLAPNAQLTSAPLVLSSTTNVHVRSYRADREGVFPGSPWSSAVGGANSSPLSPAARLVNISARALVGTGENVLIAGIVVSDTAQKSYLVRGVGPTLGSLGVANTLPDPELSIRRSDSVEIYKNTGWRNGPDVATLPAIFQSVGAFPFAATSVDSALLPQEKPAPGSPSSTRRAPPVAPPTSRSASMCNPAKALSSAASSSRVPPINASSCAASAPP